jgi:hypothetical protein
VCPAGILAPQLAEALCESLVAPGALFHFHAVPARCELGGKR